MALESGGVMSIPSFGIQVVRNGKSTSIAPSGELDIATTPALEQAISDATAEPGAALVLDLRELTFMDSTGLRTLAQTNARADDDGFTLSIVRGSRQIERVLEISGLGALLPLVDAPPE
jgi:anti-anti-sigma factor